MIVPYEPGHLLDIRHQEWQSGACQTVEHAQALAQSQCAYTALCDTTSRPLICAGITELWPGRGMAWASFDFAAKPVMLEATRRTRLELDRTPFKRVEIYVVPGFVQAWRWAEMLGFELECLMECGSPEGNDLFVFKRIRRGAAVMRLH